MNLTKKVLFIGMIVYGIYDFFVFAHDGVSSTISQVMTDYLYLSPAGAFVIGMIMGHFLWPMKVSS